MIPVPRPKKAPEGFKERCHERGRDWLAANPLDGEGNGERPRDFWSEFEPALRAAFRERCGWHAMWIPRGEVEHYLSAHPKDRARRPHQRMLAYAWSNLRYVDGSLNKRKANLDERVFDPFEVGEGWFELTPELKLRVTERCPAAERQRAERTRKLVEDEVEVARLRQAFLRSYEVALAAGMAPAVALDELRRLAPLVAELVAG